MRISSPDRLRPLTHDPSLVPPTSHSYKLSLLDPSECYLPTSFLLFQSHSTRSFPTKLQYAFLVPHIWATHPTHHNILDFTTLTILGDLYFLCYTNNYLNKRYTLLTDTVHIFSDLNYIKNVTEYFSM